jgi:hypothetical protein
VVALDGSGTDSSESSPANQRESLDGKDIKRAQVRWAAGSYADVVKGLSKKGESDDGNSALTTLK